VRPQRAATLRRGGALLAEATQAIEARFAEPDLAIGDVAREIATSGRPLQRVFAEVAEPTFQTRPQSGGVGPVTPAAFDPAALGRRPVRPRALRTLHATGDFDGEAVGAFSAGEVEEQTAPSTSRSRCPSGADAAHAPSNRRATPP